ncbi:citryl-CoA lyase [Candidatus Magnetomorum sp. HK-1]|nr:citryl-CoA lyase [Candidatus Magnetomorum sp. HK-1]
MLPRRSILSVPGHKEKMYHKAASSEADVIMLDLEDSVPFDAKDLARKSIANALTNIDWGTKTVSVRINGLDTPFAHQDIPAVFGNKASCLNSMVIPKVDDVQDIHFVSRFLDGLEMLTENDHHVGIEASIETAKGMSNVCNIAKASDRLVSLVFGIADYTASIGARLVSLSGHGENELSIYPGHRWHFALSRIVMAAKANDLLAIDAPYGFFKDKEGLTNSASIARALGCDGKWAIHPTQLSIINNIFSPLPEDIEKASQIISACNKTPNKGAIAIDGRMIDQASFRLAQQTLEQAKFLKSKENLSFT